MAPYIFIKFTCQCVVFICVASFFMCNCSQNNKLNHQNSSFVFTGKLPLQNGEMLEFIWVEEIGLWVGKYEITLGQLVDFFDDAKKRPSQYTARYVEGVHDLNGFPAVMLSWDDAKNACQTLNHKYRDKLPDGTIFRLPTENEWEVMAKSGRDHTYPWGDSWPPNPMSNGILPNLQGEEIIKIDGKVPPAIRPIKGYRDGWPSMSPVAETGANEWGIYGLAGNVSEWCEGWYDKEEKLRLLKGGSAFSNQPSQCKVSSRRSVRGQSPARGIFFWGTIQNQGTVGTGFRVVIGQEL